MYARKYETITLVNVDSGDEGVDKVLGRMREAIEKTGGREVRLEDWGRRKTAYTLQRSGADKARYLYLLYLGSNQTVAELERLMRITEDALLWQTVVLEDKVVVESFDFETEGRHLTLLARKAQAAESGEDEEDYDVDTDDDDDDEDEEDDE